MEEYIASDVYEISENGSKCPVGVLHGSKGDVRLYFLHYKTFEEAKGKWNNRKNRIIWDNIFVIMEGDDCTEEMLMDFDALPQKNKVVITNGVHNGIKSSFPMLNDFYGETYFPGKLLKYPKFGLRRYYDCFDYVEFFNSGKIRRR